MPSIILIPVIFSHASNTVRANASPADTHLLNDRRRSPTFILRICLYAVGTVRRIVGAVQINGLDNILRLRELKKHKNKLEARIGKRTSPPSPKVNTIGAFPIKMSRSLAAKQQLKKCRILLEYLGGNEPSPSAHLLSRM